MKTIKQFAWYLLGILTVTLVISYWFYPFDGFFYFWDQHAILKYTFANFSRVFSSWNYYTVAPGSSNPISITFTYFMGMNVFFSSLFGYVLGQFFYVLITFLIGYTGIFFLLKLIASYIPFKGKVLYKNLLILVTSFFYLFNIFVALYAYGDFSAYMLFFLFLPTTIFTYLIAFEKRILYPFFLIAILLQSQSIAQPTYFLNLLLYLGLFSLLLLNRHPFIRVLRYYFLSAVILIPLLSFYFLPLLLIGTYTLQADLNAIGGAQYLDFYRSYASPLQTITFNNFRLLTISNYQHVGAWVTFILDNKFLEILSSIFFMVLVYLNAKVFRSKYQTFAAVNIIFIFFGIFIPSLPYVIYMPFKWIWVRFPVVQIFRGWDQQVDHYYSIILIFVTFTTLLFLRNKVQRIIATSLFILLYGIYSYPAVTGNFFFNTHFQVKDNPYGEGVSQKVTLPQEYLRLQKIFNNEQFARILIYPWDQILSSDYFTNNTAYAGAHLISELTGKEAVGAGGGDIYYQNLLLKTFYSDPYNINIVSNAKLLGFTDIIVRKKYNTNHNFIYKDINVYHLEDLLSTTSAVVEKTKYFDVYHLQNIPIVQGKNITFAELNPTTYKVFMHNINKKTQLSYLEGYYPEWKLYLLSNPTENWCKNPIGFLQLQTTECSYDLHIISGNELQLFLAKPIFDNTHTIFQKYANTWTIDPSYIKKNFSKNYYKENKDGSIDIEFLIYFKPQATLYLGISISIITFFITSAGIVSYVLWKKRKYEK